MRLRRSRRVARGGLGLLVGTVAALAVATASASAQGVFVNEIHYDNVGLDQDEGIEVAGPAGVDLSTYALELYNGYDGTRYATVALSGVLPDQDNGHGTRFFAVPALQNGAPDGLALIGPAGVEEVLGYEGTFVAVDGPAAGMTLVDIGRFEPPSTPVGRSLQRQGVGTAAAGFAWSAPLGATPGQVNVGQRFPAPPPLVPVWEPSASEPGSAGVTVSEPATEPARGRPSARKPSIGLPPANRCVSRRGLRIGLRQPAGIRIASTRVLVAGRQVATPPTVTVVRVQRPPRRRFTVTVVVGTTAGAVERKTRRYTSCGPARRAALRR